MPVRTGHDPTAPPQLQGRNGREGRPRQSPQNEPGQLGKATLPLHRRDPQVRGGRRPIQVCHRELAAKVQAVPRRVGPGPAADP